MRIRYHNLEFHDFDDPANPEYQMVIMKYLPEVEYDEIVGYL